MKKTTCFPTLIVLLFAVVSLHATTLTWTNTGGGDWNVAANWTPAQVPVNGDSVIVTNSGTYSVTNGANVTLHNLTVGGTNGTQTVSISALSLTAAGLINSNGVFNWGGGDMSGGSLTVAEGRNPGHLQLADFRIQRRAV